MIPETVAKVLVRASARFKDEVYQTLMGHGCGAHKVEIWAYRLPDAKSRPSDA
jgi:hypothetical protein